MEYSWILEKIKTEIMHKIPEIHWQKYFLHSTTAHELFSLL